LLSPSQSNIEPLPDELEYLWNNCKFMLHAATQGCNIHEHLGTFSDNRKVILAGIQSGVLILEDASEILRRDRQLVLDAVQLDTANVRFASQEIHNYRFFVAFLVRRNLNMILYASEESKDGKEIALGAARQYIVQTLVHFSDRIRDDEEVLFAALKTEAMMMRFSKLRFTFRKERSTFSKTHSRDTCFLTVLCSHGLWFLSPKPWRNETNHGLSDTLVLSPSFGIRYGFCLVACQ